VCGDRCNSHGNNNHGNNNHGSSNDNIDTNNSNTNNSNTNNSNTNNSNTNNSSNSNNSNNSNKSNPRHKHGMTRHGHRKAHTGVYELFGVHAGKCRAYAVFGLLLPLCCSAVAVYAVATHAVVPRAPWPASIDHLDTSTSSSSGIGAGPPCFTARSHASTSAE